MRAGVDGVRVMARVARVNECGHPERKHHAKGMCGACRMRARKRDPAKRDAIRRSSLEYDARNRERLRERKRERYANDPAYRERENARRRERYANDPAYREREIERDRRYRAAKKAAKKETT